MLFQPLQKVVILAVKWQIDMCKMEITGKLSVTRFYCLFHAVKFSLVLKC